MTIKEAEKVLLEQLAKSHDRNEAYAIATTLLEHVSKTRRNSMDWHINDLPITDAEFNRYVTELNQNKPVQYIIGETWFYGNKFSVNESVLIPRPETEELVSIVISDTRRDNKSYKTALDIGTGSGCIAITLKKHLPEINTSCLDVCSEAIYIAIQNAYELQAEINFHIVDFLDESKWNELGVFDIIISNPPYIKSSEQKTMSEHVLQYEPHKALFVPDDDALLFYRKIADFALTHLAPDGKVYVEINKQLGKETANVFVERGFKDVVLMKDMSGNERFVKVSS